MDNKQIYKISGKMQTDNFFGIVPDKIKSKSRRKDIRFSTIQTSRSLDNAFACPSDRYVGGGTNLMYLCWMLCCGFENKEDVSWYLTDCLLKKAGVSRKNKITEIFEEKLAYWFVQKIKDDLRNEKMPTNEKNTLKEWLSQMQEIQNKYKKKRE
jgi:hypothetical protein